MFSTTTVESTTRASLHLHSGNRYKISRTHPHSHYTCPKFRFDWTRSKVTSHEEQGSYSPLILILWKVISPKFISLTLRIFFFSCSKFPCDWSRNMGTSQNDQILLHTVSLPVMGSSWKFIPKTPRTFPAHALSLVAIEEVRALRMKTKVFRHISLQVACIFMKIHT
jgi:hypothetical protein